MLKSLKPLLQMKQTEAAAFVETIKGPQWGGEESTVAVNVDPGMLAAMQRAALISPGWLAACTATMGTSLNSMAVLAANNNTMQVDSLLGSPASRQLCIVMTVGCMQRNSPGQALQLSCAAVG